MIQQIKNYDNNNGNAYTQETEIHNNYTHSGQHNTYTAKAKTDKLKSKNKHDNYTYCMIVISC